MASVVWSEWTQTEWVQDLLAPPLAFLHQDLLPGVTGVWLKMQVPPYPMYQLAIQTCVSDVVQSTQSTTHLMYLTLRPFILLLGMILQLVGTILHILFQHLLEHGWKSLQKGAMQAKAGAVWFYIFQRSLTRKEVLAEVGLVVLGILGYYLRKWLKRQTYVARANKWYQQRKRKVTKVRNLSIVLYSGRVVVMLCCCWSGRNAMVILPFLLLPNKFENTVGRWSPTPARTSPLSQISCYLCFASAGTTEFSKTEKFHVSVILHQSLAIENPRQNESMIFVEILLTTTSFDCNSHQHNRPTPTQSIEWPSSPYF